jgi:hypothetical protein
MPLGLNIARLTAYFRAYLARIINECSGILNKILQRMASRCRFCTACFCTLLKATPERKPEQEVTAEIRVEN